MSHDKFCALLEFSDVDHPNKLALCNCRFLATVRADEREQAAQRIESALKDKWATGWVYSDEEAGWQAAVAAARGEDASHE